MFFSHSRKKERLPLHCAGTSYRRGTRRNDKTRKHDDSGTGPQLWHGVEGSKWTSRRAFRGSRGRIPQERTKITTHKSKSLLRNKDSTAIRRCNRNLDLRTSHHKAPRARWIRPQSGLWELVTLSKNVACSGEQGADCRSSQQVSHETACQFF